MTPPNKTAMPSSSPTIDARDDPTTGSLSTDSESGDEPEAGTPLRDTMDQHRVDAIDSIMQSFCAVLDSKIALVKKTADIKVEPDPDSAKGDLGSHLPIESEFKSPILQRKGLSRQSIPKNDDSPSPIALRTTSEAKKRSSFTPRLLPARLKQSAVRRAPAPPLPPPAASAPSRQRRSILPTSSSAEGPSLRTTDNSSLFTAQWAAVASAESAPPSGLVPAPAPPPPPAGLQRSVDGQAGNVFPFLHNRFFHLPPVQSSSAPQSYDSTSRSSLGFRAPAQSFQQEPYEPDLIPTTGTRSSSGTQSRQQDERLSRPTPELRGRESRGRAPRQDLAVAAQFPGLDEASDFTTALGTSLNQNYRTSAQTSSFPAAAAFINLASTRGPNQGPQYAVAVEPGISFDSGFGYGASTSTYLDIPEGFFPAPRGPGSTVEGWNIHDHHELDASRSHVEYQSYMGSEPQPEECHFEVSEHASVPESTPPKPTTPKAADRDGRRNKRQKNADDSEPKSGDKKFACPYYKRNRKKYSKWTSCPGPGWEEVHRVKTHLYRRHGRSPQCPRCWSTFSTDDSLYLHLQQNPPCETGHNQGLVEGFSKEQEKKLRSRKKAQPNMTDEDKWRDIYMILFPDDDKESIPTPYYDETDADADESSPGPTGDLEDYATFVRREMPTLVRRELELLFENEFKDVEERLRPRVAEIVLNLQPKLLNLYKQSQTPLSEYGPQPPEETPRSGSEPVSSSRTTGTNTDSTPGTGIDGDENVLQGAENLAYFNPAEMLGWDVNSVGAGFNWDGTQPFGMESLRTGGMPGDGQVDLNWDYEFDRLLNPVLLSPPSSAVSGQADTAEVGKRKYDANF